MVSAALPVAVRAGGPSRARLVFLGLAVLGFSFALVSGIEIRENQAGLDDFNQFYVGARLVFTGELYRLPRILAEQRATVGVERPYVSPSRPPFYYVALSPLARLSYGAARRTWLAIILVATALFPIVYPRHRLAITVATTVSMPLSIAVFGAEQDVPVALLVFALGLRLHSGARRFAAGLVFSLLAIKIHLFLLLPVPFLFRRDWRTLGGLVAGGVALFAASFLAGAGWIKQYLALLSNPDVHEGLPSMPQIHGALYGVPHARGMEMLMSAAVLLCVFTAVRKGPFGLALAAAMLGGFLLSRYGFLLDCAILIPALVECACAARGAVRALAAALMTPFPYFLGQFLGDVRHGVIAAVLIGCLLAVLAFLPRDPVDRVARSHAN